MTASATPPWSRIWWRIVPLMMLAYTASYLDRVNLSFGADALRRALSMNDREFGLGAGLFFVGYICVQVPSNLLLARIGPARMICALMLGWGVLSLMFAFVTSIPQFLALRILLGAAEAGFYPGMILCLTFWVPKERLGATTSSFLLAIPLSGIIGAPLSHLLLVQCNGVLGLAGWQWMFLVEALPTLLLGIVVAMFLPDGPARAPWLSRAEKAAIAAALARAPASIRPGHDVGPEPHESALSALKSPLVLWLIAICFCQAFATYGISFWFPTVMGEVIGPDPLRRTLWTTAAFAIAAVAMLANSRWSDRRAERPERRLPHLQIPFLIVAATLTLSVAFQAVPVIALASLIIALCAQYCVIAMVFTLCTTLLPKKHAAAGIAWINSLGAFGGLLGPFLVGWIRTTTRMPALGLLSIAAVSVIGGITIAPLRRALGPSSES